jgi:hypothetical protein
MIGWNDTACSACYTHPGVEGRLDRQSFWYQHQKLIGTGQAGTGRFAEKKEVTEDDLSIGRLQFFGEVIK